MGDEIQLLVDDANAERERIARTLNLDVLAVDDDAALVFAVGAAEDLHQRGLARAVLAEQHVHFAAVQREIDAVERDDARKCFPDAVHFEDGDHGITNSE